MTAYPRLTGGLAACVVLAGLGYVAYTAQADQPQQDKPTIVINLTSGKEDLHSATMALELAGHGLKDGRAVIVFLNVRAPELADKNLPATCGLADKPAIRDTITNLMQEGATFLCCPSCMKVLGVQETDLIPGVKLATRELLFGNMGADTAVFSY
ncbi:MAG TPA: DsrE family protein [Phycisphaerae bacterium]|nr:DsrE family protein [Phycisphaerae bacterium]